MKILRGIIRVKNLLTGRDESNGRYKSCVNCGPWKDHWQNCNRAGEDFEGQLCANTTCGRLAEVGGHVKKVEAEDDDWYIIPLCRACNSMFGEEFDIPSSTMMVPANQAKSCGRPRHSQ